jgi:hypothetical protein
MTPRPSGARGRRSGAGRRACRRGASARTGRRRRSPSRSGRELGHRHQLDARDAELAPAPAAAAAAAHGALGREGADVHLVEHLPLSVTPFQAASVQAKARVDDLGRTVRGRPSGRRPGEMRTACPGARRRRGRRSSRRLRERGDAMRVHQGRRPPPGDAEEPRRGSAHPLRRLARRRPAPAGNSTGCGVTSRGSAVHVRCLRAAGVAFETCVGGRPGTNVAALSGLLTRGASSRGKGLCPCC